MPSAVPLSRSAEASRLASSRNGIDFGPAWPGVPYRGHGSDECLTIEELHRIGELTIAALWRLAGAK